MTNPKVVFAGEITHLAGVAAVVAGLVMSLHQWPVAARGYRISTGGWR